MVLAAMYFMMNFEASVFPAPDSPDIRTHVSLPWRRIKNIYYSKIIPSPLWRSSTASYYNRDGCGFYFNLAGLHWEKRSVEFRYTTRYVSEIARKVRNGAFNTSLPSADPAKTEISKFCIDISEYRTHNCRIYNQSVCTTWYDNTFKIF